MTSLIVGLVGAFLLAALPGQRVIAMLRGLNAKQNISENAPAAHAAKQGTPTMGGVLILGSLTVTTLAYVLVTQIGAHRSPEQDYMLLPVLLLTLAFGAIGFADDFLSAKRGKNLGLRAREKMALQFVAAIAFVIWLAATARAGYTTQIVVSPFSGSPIDLGSWFYPLAILFIVGFSNATNFSDGLDGLSSGLVILICFAVGALALQSPFESLSFFSFALAGALLGFLWWNAHPARVFMGDTASLALGAALCGIAILAKQEIGLIVASLVCWAELISVMIQVSVFKWRKRTKGIEYARANRVFRRTPLHHHFEELGWPETQVVTRFWIAGAICAIVAQLWGRS